MHLALAPMPMQLTILGEGLLGSALVGSRSPPGSPSGRRSPVGSSWTRGRCRWPRWPARRRRPSYTRSSRRAATSPRRSRPGGRILAGCVRHTRPAGQRTPSRGWPASVAISSAPAAWRRWDWRSSVSQREGSRGTPTPCATTSPTSGRLRRTGAGRRSPTTRNALPFGWRSRSCRTPAAPRVRSPSRRRSTG